MTRIAIVAAAVTLLVSLAPAAPAAKKRGQTRLDLTSTVLDQPLVLNCTHYKRIKFTGTIDREGGTGEVILDANSFIFNSFGDITGGTQIAVRTVKVRFSRLPADDPAGRGRRIYKVVGDGLPAPMYLVVPAGGTTSYRLLVNPETHLELDPFITGKYFDRVIPLEPVLARE